MHILFILPDWVRHFRNHSPKREEGEKTFPFNKSTFYYTTIEHAYSCSVSSLPVVVNRDLVFH